jgi:drug/metabolite transporter (DMT)-like permease
MALLFGLSFVATKFALQSIPPFTLIFLRFSFASLFLAVFYFRRKGSRLLREDRRRMFFASLIVPGLYFLAETYGLKLSSATSVSMLISTIPIFAGLFGFLILKERIGLWRGAAIFLSIAGVGIILSANAGGGEAWEMAHAGNLLGLGAAVCAGLYMAIGRDLTSRYSPLTITTFQAFFAVAIFLPLAGMEMFTQGWGHVGPLTLLAVVYLALFCSVLAFFLWNYGISRFEASKAAVFTNLVPVFTVLGASFFLGERIFLEQVIGGILVICGVSLASASQGKIDRQKEQNCGTSGNPL